MNALELAQKFHDTYELLAPSFGYTTREETRVFDPESPNGRLMCAVCDQILFDMATASLAARVGLADPNELNLIDTLDAIFGEASVIVLDENTTDEEMARLFNPKGNG